MIYMEYLSDEVIFMVDKSGRFTYISKNVEKYGYKPEEVIGKHFMEFIHESEKETMKNRFEKALELIKEYNYYEEIYKTRVITKNGNSINALVHVYYLKDFGTFLCILKDITDKENLIDKLRALNRKMFLLKNIIRRNIVALDIISHDILNQIFSLKNYVEILKGYNLSPEIMNVLNRMEDCIERIIEIVRDSIKLAKLQKISDFKKIDMNLRKLVETVIKSLENKAKKKNIEIINNVNEIVVKLNPIFINVIENLLDNAIKYSYENSKVIIESKELDGKVRIYVKDFGIGIPDEYKEKIFKRFERKSKEGIKGTGLGLAIVKRIVELHGGRVWVEDNKPRGSVFIVEIPR